MPAVEQPAERGEQGMIRGPRCRSNDLTAQHGDLVAEQDDLDRQLAPVSPAETHPLEDPGNGEVNERQGLWPSFVPQRRLAKALFMIPR